MGMPSLRAAVRIFALALTSTAVASTPAWSIPHNATDRASLRCDRQSIAHLADQALASLPRPNGEPGVTLAVYAPLHFADPISAANGYSDLDRGVAIQPDARMLAGSIGKTLYAAAALRLADDGRLDLDQAIGHYLPDADIPNAERVSVRMLLSHTSGFGEYDEAFIRQLIAEPLRERTLADWTGPLHRTPPAAPGAFRYSDINFVVLAAVIDAVVDGSATDYISAQFLVPYRLRNTVASDRPALSGLTPGYAGPRNFFGRDAMVENGGLIFNPQFESGGGGYMSTSADLARWITLLSVGNFFSYARLREALTPVHRDTETGKAYGLGIHIDPTPLGVAYGHSGYIPGYYSWARFYPAANIGIAMQTNSSDDARVPWDGYDTLNQLAVSLNDLCNS